jgi:hypothetical protein
MDGGTISADGSVTVGPHGTLRGNGTVEGATSNTGTLSPGLSAGNLSVAGNYTQSAGGKLEVELFGTNSGEWDTLQITGTAALGGELEITLGETGGNPFVPQLDDSFTFLTASLGAAGHFAAVDLPSLAAGQMWQLRYATNSVTLAVTLAGDYNDDGTVNAADYIIWRRSQGTGSLQADGDTNGVINGSDYAVWREVFGANGGSGASMAANAFGVPEPSSGVLFVALVLLRSVARPYRRCRSLDG